MTKKIILMEIETNPNIGLFIFANDKFALCPKTLKKEQLKVIEETLNVPCYQITINNSDLLGVFLAGNNDLIISPKLSKYEEENLNEICNKHEVNLIQIENKLNAFGNLIKLTEKNIIFGNEINTSLKKELEKTTKLKSINIDDTKYIGAGGILFYANQKLIASQELSEDVLNLLQKELSAITSINSGSEFIASGLIGNKNGIIIGSQSSTIEIQNIVENMDYL